MLLTTLWVFSTAASCGLTPAEGVMKLRKSPAG